MTEATWLPRLSLPSTISKTLEPFAMVLSQGLARTNGNPLFPGIEHDHAAFDSVGRLSMGEHNCTLCLMLRFRFRMNDSSVNRYDGGPFNGYVNAAQFDVAVASHP